MTPAIEVIQNEKFRYNDSKTDYVESFCSKGNFLQQELILDAFKEQIERIDHEICDVGEDDAFFVADLGEVYRSYGRWKRMLPNVQPYYAVKCNPNPTVLKLLGELGANFDCASLSEIDTVLNLSFSPERIIFANTCKSNSHIRYAKNVNVGLTTVDNTHELYKLKKHHPDCGILIRIATDDEEAQCRLSMKFGCTLDSAVNELLPLAEELQLNVKGVSFHVGSGAKNFDSIYEAIEEARVIFDTAREKYNRTLSVLDIGGGFESETFNESSRVVKLALENFFPTTFCDQYNMKIIAEPGRFMVANAFTLAVNVIARRDALGSLLAPRTVDGMLYVNDGVYGNLNCILFDHQHPRANVLCHNSKYYFGDNEESPSSNELYYFSIWGPTCDGLDCISKQSNLPCNVQVGDWLYFSNLGAYTSAASTSFNGFKQETDVIFVASENLSQYGL